VVGFEPLVLQGRKGVGIGGIARGKREKGFEKLPPAPRCGRKEGNDMTPKGGMPCFASGGGGGERAAPPQEGDNIARVTKERKRTLPLHSPIGKKGQSGLTSFATPLKREGQWRSVLEKKKGGVLSY